MLHGGQIHITESGKEKISFNHIPLANEIMDEIPLLHNNKGFHYYDISNGIWKQNTKKFLQQLIADKLDEYSKIQRINETYSHIEIKSYKNSDEQKFEERSYLVNFINGVYDIKTNNFMKHNKNFYQTIQIPVVYDENAVCSKIDIFLSELFEAEEKQFILEWFGYNFIKTYIFQKLLILKGNGGNGKSTLIALLQNLLGKENISNVPLYKLKTIILLLVIYI